MSTNTTAIPLPKSISPHICILPSAELDNHLSSSNFPALHHILQSLSPLSEVFTRTINITPVRHESFHVRFSNYRETLSACNEEPANRASRFLDWVGSRIFRKASQWVQELQSIDTSSVLPLPWWEELKECIECDVTPNPYETWNHPVAVVLAISARASNPLQELESLHQYIASSKWPEWTETQIYRCNLVVSDVGSSFSEEEAMALTNAMRKQYGCPTFFIQLDLHSSASTATTCELTSLPRLPPYGIEDNSSISGKHSSLSSRNLENFKMFLREFVTVNLIPWMEKAVLDWSELLPARRITTRLLSSTRRFFGSSYHQTSLQRPTNGEAPSISERTLNQPSSFQRRLAEFATILGDYKTALANWDALTKEYHTGLDVALLVSPNLPDPLRYVLGSLKTISDLAPIPICQVLSVMYAIRWESSPLDASCREKEKAFWLVEACALTDEVAASTLLGHAAHLVERRNPEAARRVAMWYTAAADKLEKHGIKPITRYYLQQASRLLHTPRKQLLSPSFVQSEFMGNEARPRFTAALLHVSHCLARLYYATGDIQKSLDSFHELFQLVTPIQVPAYNDFESTFLDDFQVAFQHSLMSIDNYSFNDAGFPLRLVECMLFTVDMEAEQQVLDDEWLSYQHAWEQHISRRDNLFIRATSCAEVGVHFWVHVHFSNPLNAAIYLKNVTLCPDANNLARIEVEMVDEVVLQPVTNLRISFRARAVYPGSCEFHGVAYRFMDLFDTYESLSTPGKRINDSPGNMKRATYAPPSYPRIEIEKERLCLKAEILDDKPLELILGECRELRLFLKNIGREEISKMWLMTYDDIGLPLLFESQSASGSDIWETNSQFRERPLICQASPLDISGYFPHSNLSLEHDSSFILPLSICPSKCGESELRILLISEGVSGKLYFTRLQKHVSVFYEIQLSAYVSLSTSSDQSFRLGLRIDNMSGSEPLELIQISTLSPSWGTSTNSCIRSSISQGHQRRVIFSGQACHFDFEIAFQPPTSESEFSTLWASNWITALKGPNSTKMTELADINILHTIQYKNKVIPQFLGQAAFSCWRFGRRRRAQEIVDAFGSSCLPTMHPRELDFLVFWRRGGRCGVIDVTGLVIGNPSHDLHKLFPDMEEIAERSLYPASRRDKYAKVQSLRNSIWNECKIPAHVDLLGEEIYSHDFAKGPLQIPVTIIVHNRSVSFKIDFTMIVELWTERFSSEESSSSICLLGNRVFRGSLCGLGSQAFETTILVSRWGTYSVGGSLMVTVLNRHPEQTAFEVYHSSSHKSGIHTFEVHQSGLINQG